MPKDPNKPRGRTTAYGYFVVTEKETFQKENPGAKINFGDFSKLCGKKWQGMGEEDRVDFEEKAGVDKIRYEREMSTYEAPPGEKKKTKKRKKDPNAPKRPPTAFFLFSTEHRAEAKSQLEEGAKVGDVAKKLGEMWRAITPEEKERFGVKASEAKEGYEQAMAEYKAKDAKTISSKRRKKATSSEDEPDDPSDEDNDY